MEEPLAEFLEVEVEVPPEEAVEPEVPPPEATVAGGRAEPAPPSLEHLATKLDRLREEFLARAAQDDFRERQIDRLHAEVQEHRSDLLGQLERPVLLGLIRLHDDLGRTAEALRRRDPATLTVETVLSAFEGFQEDIELLLGQHQVERYETPEVRFDPRRQTAVRTLAAPEAEHVGAVAQRVRPGFVRGDFTLQKERVAVYAAVVHPPNLGSGAES
jgi:molecular chaperone GrpE (heat shock protein)